jgi:hypothetical protein
VTQGLALGMRATVLRASRLPHRGSSRGTQNGTRTCSFSFRIPPRYASVSEGGSSSASGSDSLIMPGSRVRVPPLLLVNQIAESSCEPTASETVTRLRRCCAMDRRLIVLAAEMRRSPQKGFCGRRQGVPASSGSSELRKKFLARNTSCDRLREGDWSRCRINRNSQTTT